MKITIRKVGTSPNEFIQEIAFKFITVQEGLKVLGEDTRNQMITHIQSNKKRAGSEGNLEKHILVHTEVQTKKRSVVGVGLISLLNAYAPYWNILNYGGLSGVAQQGKLVPGYFGSFNAPNPALKGTGVGREHWEYTPGNAMFFMKPESPIAAVNYIEKTIAYITTVWKVQFYNWTKQTKVLTK